MLANVADIAYELGLTEEVLAVEAVRMFLKVRLGEIEEEILACCPMYGVKYLQCGESRTATSRICFQPSKLTKISASRSFSPPCPQPGPQAIIPATIT